MNSSPKSALFRFAYFPRYDNAIKFLAETLTGDEKWDFSDSELKKYSILKNYLEYTFRKLKQEQKIEFSRNNKYACFNTGLVTPNLEDIITFFEKYKKPKPGFTTP